MKVTVLGSLNVDYVMWADRLPTRGETVLGHTFRTFVGGKGANQAVQAALIGAEAYMVGRVGRDFMGEMVMESLRSKGVRTDLLVADPENPTGAACIYVDDGGDNYLMVVENANGKVGVPDVDAAMGAMRDSEALIVQNEIPLMTVAYAMEAARGMGKLAVLDPAPYKAGGHALFRHATVITPNET
ncbi:MAG: PfkB family carbohydrate kinase, partial [Oscillospiraceae bacterium]|nr:PfkB family carbohydrate kinase [Oscillospiraceae bacterium]